MLTRGRDSTTVILIVTNGQISIQQISIENASILKQFVLVVLALLQVLNYGEQAHPHDKVFISYVQQVRVVAGDIDRYLASLRVTQVVLELEAGLVDDFRGRVIKRLVLIVYISQEAPVNSARAKGLDLVRKRSVLQSQLDFSRAVIHI
jgi:hypothetical protein